MDSGFLPHGMCFLWDPRVLSLHVISDAFTAIAYFSIPIVLVWFIRHRKDLPFQGIFAMFGIFIIACGTTHVLSIWTIWHPDYWLSGWVKAVTASASLATAVMLVPLIPRALRLRSPHELDHLNAILRELLDEKDELLARYRREHFVANSFQSASLAGQLPQVDGLTFDAVYAAGASDLEVGGDWYDAFPLGDGRIAVSIGDVAGSGLNAAITMGKMRQAIRVAAQIQVEPSAILNAADRALRAEEPDRIVTAFVGLIDNVEGTMAYASAGHPPPLIRRADGSIVELAFGSLPLGLRERTDNAQATIALEGGSLIVLYTDGLTESTHDILAGERRLRDALELQATATSANPAREIYDLVLHDGARDDVAILTLRVESSSGPSTRWNFDVRDSAAADEVRLAIVRELASAGATQEGAIVAELIYSELIGNVMRHAPGKVQVRLDWYGGAPVLHVLDEGPGFQHIGNLPKDILSESGRGLFLVGELAEGILVHRRPGIGSHARVNLALVKSRVVPLPTDDTGRAKLGNAATDEYSG